MAILKARMALLKKTMMAVIKKTKMALLKKIRMAVIKKTKMALLKKIKMVVIKKTKIKIEQEKQENIIMVIVDSVIYSRLSDIQSVYGKSICQYKFSLRTQGEYSSINRFVYLQQAFLTLTAEKTKTQGQNKKCLHTALYYRIM